MIDWNVVVLWLLVSYAGAITIYFFSRLQSLKRDYEWSERDRKDDDKYLKENYWRLSRSIESIESALKELGMKKAYPVPSKWVKGETK